MFEPLRFDCFVIFQKGEIEDGANDRASVDTVITTDIEDHCVKKESVDKSLDVDNSVK